jgi:hypothetical protein
MDIRRTIVAVLLEQPLSWMRRRVCFLATATLLGLNRRLICVHGAVAQTTVGWNETARTSTLVRRRALGNSLTPGLPSARQLQRHFAWVGLKKKKKCRRQHRTSAGEWQTDFISQ